MRNMSLSNVSNFGVITNSPKSWIENQTPKRNSTLFRFEFALSENSAYFAEKPESTMKVKVAKTTGDPHFIQILILSNPHFIQILILSIGFFEDWIK